MDNLKESYIDAYTNWFPATKLKMRNAPHLELYDERFDPTSNKCEMDILIPVK
jgi:predicted transcriptional regulator YdeE